jgi:single-strand DNA-binding protein
MQMLGSREGSGEAPSASYEEAPRQARAPAARASSTQRPAPAAPAANLADMDDDIPF